MTGKQHNESVLFFSSLYTSLVETVVNKKWPPRGLPAYYKLIEELSLRNIPLVIIYHCRKPLSGFGRVRKIRVEEINAEIYVLPWYEIKIVPERIERLVNRLYHFSSITCYVLKYRPGLIYTDKSHTRQAAFFTFLGKKVFLRVYGITKELFDFMERNSKKIIKNSAYYSFFAKYAYVLGSLDGSDIDLFFTKYLDPKVPNKIMLNGADSFSMKDDRSFNVDIKKKYEIPDNSKIILFLSRFSPEKGGRQFIEVVDELRKKTQNIFSLMIGYGPLENYYREIIIQRQLADFIEIISGLDHSEVLSVLPQTDLYISFNEEGNICNTVLEALKAEVPVLTYMDRHTLKLYNDSVVYAKKNDTPVLISNKILELITNETKLGQYRRNASNFAENNLKSWQERIEEEVRIIEQLLYNKFEI